MNNIQVFLYTLGLILVWMVVLVWGSGPFEPLQSVVDMSDEAKDPRLWKIFKEHINENDVQKHERNCKGLCQHCGCMGFYCGEECICECNDENSNTDCIATMQSNAKKLDIPYEILIQGPARNGFVRTAQQFELNSENKNDLELSNNRNRRSTVTIYKPTTHDDDSLGRLKRASLPDGAAELDWFSDLTSALVRPAPIPNKRSKKVSIEDSSAVHKRSPKIDFDRSWFSDNNNNLLRPAPISKRQSSQKNSLEGLSQLADPMAMVERIPKVIKNTLRSFQERDEPEDLWTAPPATLSDFFKPDKRERGNKNRNEALIEMQRWRDSIMNAFGKFMEDSNERLKKSAAPATTTTTTEAVPADRNGGFILPWFRPMKFFQRMQNALQ